MDNKQILPNLNTYLIQGILYKIISIWTVFNREGVSMQEVIHIRAAFDNLRDENDKPNEVKLSKLKKFPFFNKSDLVRIMPRDSERFKN